MLGNRIKLDDDLFEKIKKCSEMAGYSSRMSSLSTFSRRRSLLSWGRAKMRMTKKP